MENLTQPFTEAFKALTGNPPFPWQTRLFHALAANTPPAQLDIPTGLGKTSIIPLWLLAHLFSEPATRPPMRLVYVVNRRTIVDQATTIAASLWTTIETTPTLLQLWQNKFDPQWSKRKPADENPNKLSVSTLRGALADNREWMRYPHRPAIIVGTVDMIGSRLLFDAYRAGKWTKAMHAGLLGQDSLLVHDEAHLSTPFQNLLEWITIKQSRDHSPKPMQLLAMSATGESKESDVLALNEDDRELPAVRQRINAKKRLTLHPLIKGKSSDELVKLASLYAAHDTAPKKIIIFVRQPETAKTIVNQLTEKLKLTPERIKLLTGTLRGNERDDLVNSHVLQQLLRVKEPTTPLTDTIYLVATSAGEVGADFDADHLLCDLAPLDSMIQRLGRVNRRGEGDAQVHVVVDGKAPDKAKPHEIAALNTAAWLSRLPPIPNDPNDRFDASPATLRALRESDPPAYAAACSPKPLTIYPHNVTLDAWALTSIQDNWPLAAELDDYLHGRSSEYEPPRTTLAWRNEITHFFPFNSDDRTNGQVNNECRAPFEKWLDLAPLHPRELVNDKSEKVATLLAAIAARFPAAPLIRIQRRTIYFETFGDFAGRYDQLENNQKKYFADSLADQTLILPTEVGGLSPDGSIHEQSTSLVLDVGDKIEQNADGSLKTPDRLRIWLKQSEDDLLTPTPVSATTSPSLNLSNTQLAKSDWRDAIARLFKPRMKLVGSQRFQDEDQTVGILALFKPQLIDQRDKQEHVLLTDHNDDAHSFALQFAQPLTLPPHCIAAIELAAHWHDLGKNRELWQTSIKNPNKDEPLAKSCGRGMNSDSLHGYRHEFGSLVDVAFGKKVPSLPQQLAAISESQRDLVLHLIAAHHGRSRPHFPDPFDPDHQPAPNIPASSSLVPPPGPAASRNALTATPTDNADHLAPLLTPAEIARRYARLQRTYGHWGLAYLESLVMCADHAASRGEEPEDTQ